MKKTMTLAVALALFFLLIPGGAEAQEAFGLYDETGGLMLNLTPRAVISAALLVPTLALGYWLAHTGRPYNQIVLTAHKLLPLANLVLLNYTVYQVHKLGRLSGGDIPAMVLMNLCFAATIVTGGLVSLETPMPEAVRWVHKLGPWACVLSSGLLFYTLWRG